MFENITLEMSLKPFKKVDDESIRCVCAQIFEQWKPLLKNRESIAVMFWVGDGSEILDYAGNLDDEFEWCRFVGTANKPLLPEGAPKESRLHGHKQHYIENAPKMTYGILKKIIAILREEATRSFPDAKFRVGETFDIGPEFAISDFKYVRHTEICTGSKLEHQGFVDATACLSADDRYYAAYPNGIPEGTPFGTFLGKQSQIFLTDMGFDYLWLSNGLGFSADPWKLTGKIFDGERYYPEKLDETRKKVFEFWTLFRKECSFPLETRGTNNSVGIDYASDGVPLHDIYSADLDIIAPPNSPWAALNDNVGLELMGHMTRICELPNDTFPFRYYIHDPWWINSPWYDRYDGAPYDIYLPMSVSRITSDGRVESANSLNILSIDNSYGDMPDQCVNEPLPHLLKAEKDIADAPAPLVWIYPMREYTTTHDAALLREMNLGDRYICDAINCGLPLSCVVSTDHFLLHERTLYKKSILISPVPENAALLKKLLAFAKEGQAVIFYGTQEKLATLPQNHALTLLDVEKDPNSLRESLAAHGFSILFDKKADGIKVPTVTVTEHDRALFFSVYNANTTTDARFRFPLGAPILCGFETEIIDGHSTYRFDRAEHRECRIFVDQKDGIISCRECPPVNARYRRVMTLRGLKDATVCLFSEKDRECMATRVMYRSDTPIKDDRFTLVQDEKYGEYLYGEHIDGDISFMIGR